MLNKSTKAIFSAAEKAGITALSAAFLLFFLNPWLAIFPLVLFLLLCLVAPFFPASSFFLSVISKGSAAGDNVCLTFDDGPSPSSTPVILELLARHKLAATFFVVGEKAANYPQLIADIVSQGHTVGNHSWNHDSFLMLRSQEKLQEDVCNTQEVLIKQGVRPHVFRPPAAVTGPRLGQVLTCEGLVTVTYSCRAMDRGNRNIRNLAAKIFNRLQAGDIIMLHDLVPYREGQMDCWQHELELLFTGLQEKYNIVSLEQLIQQPVMTVLH
ncbi:MAG: polysaccharide deacetylase family protein [Deltaproteobacteria bacterium]|nr:polysaccharide deacetylase family protein [Deltaproteobacteria bacterium]